MPACAGERESRDDWVWVVRMWGEPKGAEALEELRVAQESV